jgi:ligand-binding SRPBCC domain-containing protein
LAIITLHTIINAPVERVFNLSRSIDLHTTSTERTNEKAIAGRTSGLIEEGEQVTWEAKHLGKIRQHTSLVTAVQPPHFFEDKMIKGDFKYFRHQHHFQPQTSGTLMIDILEFASPYSLLGKLVDLIFMKRYLTRFLKERNTIIKQYAETDKWKTLLPIT